MPLYEYRCRSCQTLTTAMKRLDESAAPVACEACGAVAERIVSPPAVHRDKAGKLGRLDPKYDRMVDRAMANTQYAEPDRVLKRVESRSKP